MGQSLARAMTGKESTDMWEGQSMSTSQEGRKKAGQPASPGLPGANGKCSVSPSSQVTGLRETPRWDTVVMCCREKAVCTLVPQRLTVCCHHCVDMAVRSVDVAVRSIQEPALPHHTSPFQNFMLGKLPAECPSPNPLVCKYKRERGLAVAHGLGNDVVANHQVGSRTHSAFWTPVTFA